MSTLKPTFSRSCSLLGLACLIVSLFFPTIAQQMTESHEQVEVWESPAHTHMTLALGPLGFALDLIDITLDPDEYGVRQAGDGYEQLIKERMLQFLCSIPISISWFMVWGTPFFTKTPSPTVLKRQRLVGFAMLLSAVILSRNYYSAATLYEGHFDLGPGAYLIVGSFLLCGIGLLRLPKEKAADNTEQAP